MPSPSCSRCGGVGFCWPQDGHGARAYPLPDHLQVEPLNGWTEDEIVTRERIIARQEREQESCYPCSECNARLFHRWREGHFDPNHDRANCDDEACKASNRLPR